MILSLPAAGFASGEFEAEVLQEGVESAWQKWVDTVSGSGLDGQEVLDKALEYIETYNAQN